MISRSEALQHIAAISPIDEAEQIPLQAGVNRTLAAPVVAQHTHPPDNMSAMDGYAVRSEDAELNAVLSVIGEAPAGHPFSGMIGQAECVRVFTGSVIPEGADHVVIQEDVVREGDQITIQDAQGSSRHIRPAGIDFRAGDVLIPEGTRLSARMLSICAAANLAELKVQRSPRIALLANGDELRPPGSKLEPGQIIASNEYSLTALIEAWGGTVINLGIAPDDPSAIRAQIESAAEADVFVPVGGASVGDHDHMKSVFTELGFEPIFTKVAVRPGKPTWMSRARNRLVLGLPGNPASALVCAHLFLKPLVKRLLGGTDLQTIVSASLSEGLNANGQRESFLRGRMSFSDSGERVVMPAGNQDSSLLSPFVTSNVLIHRAVGAAACVAGDQVDCVLLD
nr:gephyrin-like molybdotransferase Glp [Hyphomonas sp. Mor2]